MNISKIATSGLLATLFMANGAHAGFFSPSTTDYLVRFQALRYLDWQLEEKTALEKELNSAEAKKAEATEEEKKFYEEQINAAKQAWNDVFKEKQELLSAMQKEYGGLEKGLKASIEAEEKK